MKDVAALAGVSLGTVSKVMNNIPVGDEYRIRVEEAARNLGYRVNNYARTLKTNRTNTVAVLMPSASHPFFGLLIDHLTRSIRRRNLNIMLFRLFWHRCGSITSTFPYADREKPPLRILRFGNGIFRSEQYRMTM